MMTHPLLPKLRQLRLSGMLETLDLRAAQSIERQLAPVEFLALLCERGIAYIDYTREELEEEFAAVDALNTENPR